ncbi:hypothetical protein ACOMHN_010054 [Nucella lapillus]
MLTFHCPLGTGWMMFPNQLQLSFYCTAPKICPQPQRKGLESPVVQEWPEASDMRSHYRLQECPVYSHQRLTPPHVCSARLSEQCKERVTVARSQVSQVTGQPGHR